MKNEDSSALKFDDFFEEGRLKLALRLCIFFSSLFFILTCIEAFNSFNNFITYSFCSLFSFSVFLYLKKTKKYKVVYFVLCLVGSLLAFLTLCFLKGDIPFGNFLWMVLVIILAFWGLGNKFGILFLVINLISVTWYQLFYLEENFLAINPITYHSKLSLIIELSTAFIAISSILHQYIKNFQFSYNKIIEVNNQLAESNRIITAKNEENILLLKEVHHRVKNNLQIITSLLRLQKNEVNPEAQEKFDETINRILAMALVHRKLYQSKDISKVNIETYINDLAKEISNSFSSNKNNISINVKSNYNYIGLKTVIPLGLILNELLSNSYKHAFTPNEKGSIEIDLNFTNHIDFTMRYSDSGTWKVPDKENSKFGLELINTLTEQLDGNLSVSGSVFLFNLKNLDVS